MPWDTDQMFFRRKADSSFSNWLEVVHSGNINTFTSGIQTALNLKAPFASPAFTGSISTTGDIACSNGTATTITANKSLTIQQTGDAYGTSSLTLQNRNNTNGTTIQKLSSTATLADVALQTSSFTRYMRS